MSKRAGAFFSRSIPFLTYLLVQVLLWMLCYLVLSSLFYLVIESATDRFELRYSDNLLVALIFGFAYGIAAGLVGWFFEMRFFYNKALWLIIFGKVLISLLVFIILIKTVQLLLYPFLPPALRYASIFTNPRGSRDGFYLLLACNFVIELLLTFLSVVRKKYGPGILFPLLMGKYRSPKEESRIFLFMDLKSSTAMAETLGHIRYSAFIRDSIMDINSLLNHYGAQIYQYVGDEIVITWRLSQGLRNAACIEFFFACAKKLNERADYYHAVYGRIPEFKAGLHMGNVTAVEVGDIKRDIAYHGDTINTAARIQEICNDYQANFLTSVYVLDRINGALPYEVKRIGAIRLKGKTSLVEIASIEKTNPINPKVNPR
jgi:adenylate cyclase